MAGYPQRRTTGQASRAGLHPNERSGPPSILGPTRSLCGCGGCPGKAQGSNRQRASTARTGCGRRKPNPTESPAIYWFSCHAWPLQSASPASRSSERAGASRAGREVLAARVRRGRLDEQSLQARRRLQQQRLARFGVGDDRGGGAVFADLRQRGRQRHCLLGCSYRDDGSSGRHSRGRWSCLGAMYVLAERSLRTTLA